MGHNGSKKRRHPKTAFARTSYVRKKQASAEAVAVDSCGRLKIPSASVKNRDKLNNMHIVFRFDAVDLDDECPWSLARISTDDHADLLHKLKEFEKSTVGELNSQVMGEFKVYKDFSLCPNSAAVKRLGEQYEREGDSIARFRISGAKRLYGFLVDNQFHIVWWDAEHAVWPSKKKHT